MLFCYFFYFHLRIVYPIHKHPFTEIGKKKTETLLQNSFNHYGRTSFQKTAVKIQEWSLQIHAHILPIYFWLWSWKKKKKRKKGPSLLQIKEQQSQCPYCSVQFVENTWWTVLSLWAESTGRRFSPLTDMRCLVVECVCVFGEKRGAEGGAGSLNRIYFLSLKFAINIIFLPID